MDDAAKALTAAAAVQGPTKPLAVLSLRLGSQAQRQRWWPEAQSAYSPSLGSWHAQQAANGSADIINVH
jgi:hypothetical protein